MRDVLERWLAYDQWANRETLRSLRSGAFGERARKLMAHVAAAERLWHERLLGRPQSMAVWPNLTLDQSAALLEGMAARWQEYLSGLSPAVTTYTNSKGEARRNTGVHELYRSGAPGLCTGRPPPLDWATLPNRSIS